jgi:hypothetical protein
MKSEREKLERVPLAWCESMRGRKGEEGKRRGGVLYKCQKKLGGDMEMMKKKTAVLLALISICLIAMAGIVAVSASDEPVADVVYEPIANVTLSKINPDGTTTLVKTGNTSVTATLNENGTVNITTDDIQASEDEPVADVALYKINPDGTTTLVKTGNTSIVATSDENGTVNIEVDGSSTISNETIKRISVMVDFISGMIYAGEHQLKLAGIMHPEGYPRRHPESEPTIQVKVDFANKTIDAGGKQLKLIGIKKISRDDIIEEKGHGKVSISGQLDSGEGCAHGPWYFAEGVELFVEIDHSPSDVDVLLAVVDIWWSGEGIIDSNHDGYACFDYTIPEGGDYYTIVGAPDGGFDYEGWLHWYW